MPEVLQWQRERLLQRFEEVHYSLNRAALEQEILLAQRIDVAEELIVWKCTSKKPTTLSTKVVLSVAV